MQYKNNTKLIIDKRKLDVLIRLGCPDKQLLQIVKTGKFDKTGDSLIDDTLECLVDLKEFKGWGGNHNPTGKNQYTKRGQVDLQDDGQLDAQDEAQDIGQDVDKDIDKDKYNIINKFKNNLKLNNKFNIDYNFSIKSIPDYEVYLKEVGETVLLDVQSWLIEKKQGEVVDKEFICRQIINFAKRRGIL